MPITQWVNLTKHDRWKADDAETTARMDELEVKFTFQEAVRAPFRYQLDPKWFNASYTQAEKDRNGRFAADTRVFAAETGADGTLVVRVPLPPAGGGKFVVKGWKVGRFGWSTQSQESDVFITARRLFYRFAAMPNVPALDLAAVEAAYWNVDDKLYLQLVKVGGDVALNDAPMFYGTEEAIALSQEIEAATSLGTKAALGFTIALVHRCGTQKDQTTIEQRVLPIPPETGALADITLQVDGVGPLFAPPADVNNVWLKRCTYAYTDLDGRVQTINVRRDDVALVSATSVSITVRAGDLRRVRYLDVPHPLPITLTLKLVAVIETSGAAFQRIGLTVLATEKEAGVFGAARIQVAAIHEIGHIIGMVQDGTAHLAAPPHHYTEQNHKGPHCAKGATFAAGAAPGQDGTWSGTPGCVMFGAALRDATSGPAAPATYCSDCVKLVRKLDLRDLP